jgi:hypothetical protein
MSRLFFVTIIIFLFVGCSQDRIKNMFFYKKEHVLDYNELNFERSLDIKKNMSVVTNQVSIRFDGASFSAAMRLLSERSGLTIVWSRDLDSQQVSGLFVEQSIESVLSALARRYGVHMSRVGSIFYLGVVSQDDVVTAVFRLPPSNKDEVLTGIRGVLSDFGRVSVVGSVVWVSDRFEFVQKILSDVTEITELLNKSYVAEVFFIRISENKFANLAADLRINSVDVFSSAFNIEQLFSCVVSGDASLGGSVVESRPVLYLSEGRVAKLDLGSSITAAKKAVNERGVIETIGYEKFSDGLSLSLLLCRVFEGLYSVALDLSISTFDKIVNDSGVPNSHSQVLKVPGILCNDNSVCFVGQLRKTDKTKNFSVFGFDSDVSTDLITIWLRVREVK